MKTHFYLVVILAFLLNGSSAEAKDKCAKILNELAATQMQFVGCMVRKSLTAESCVGCITEYKDMFGNYTNLASNTNCSKEIFNKNRLNIAYNMQKELVDLWNKGFCNDCFDDKGLPSNQTSKFVSLSTSLTDCINNTKNEKICMTCSPRYDDLNMFYKQMDEKNQGQICFDTQDAMNRTRSHWSKDLKCCKRKYDFTFFIIASSMFGALPIVFYFGMFTYTKRMERNHEVLDAGRNDNATTSTNIHASRTSQIQERPIRRNSSSDEDIIDDIKKQRHVSSTENKSESNSVQQDKLQTLKRTSQPIASGSIDPLIEL